MGLDTAGCRGEIVCCRCRSFFGSGERGSGYDGKAFDLTYVAQLSISSAGSRGRDARGFVVGA